MVRRCATRVLRDSTTRVESSGVTLHCSYWHGGGKRGNVRVFVHFAVCQSATKSQHLNLEQAERVELLHQRYGVIPTILVSEFIYDSLFFLLATFKDQQKCSKFMKNLTSKANTCQMTLRGKNAHQCVRLFSSFVFKQRHKNPAVFSLVLLLVLLRKWRNLERVGELDWSGRV